MLHFNKVTKGSTNVFMFLLKCHSERELQHGCIAESYILVPEALNVNVLKLPTLLCAEASLM